ncbi:HGxxPAAW family protein [Herbiconiux sp. L3-i23]|uniref:HGxxPAAW family protein n=1 Tax=Herbiconiux sp. L3-i23 TaxID=2905871 RepID=UPI002046EB91|nr:HGxxPAAW family protein [Herbiconiux sp. L3-i23]BDI22762.1 hypothetical protein L3i23_15380 [Herbiconiux sp. L3-i23]
MTNDHSEPGHGDSPAAWTAVVISLLGFALGTVALFLDWYPVVYVAAGVIVLGFVIGWILSKAGYGVKGPRYVPKAHN